MASAEWLQILSMASLVIAALCSVLIIAHLLGGHRQHMWIMNVVWPVTALYLGPLALWAYFKWGRLSSHPAVMDAKQSGQENPGRKKPFWQMCAVGATHCGAGCTLGDIVADSLSLTAWQIGMYGWMALVTFVFFGQELHKTGPVFWFMMQIAMWCGFLTSYPVNWWLLKRKIKEAM